MTASGDAQRRREARSSKLLRRVDSARNTLDRSIGNALESLGDSQAEFDFLLQLRSIVGRLLQGGAPDGGDLVVLALAANDQIDDRDMAVREADLAKLAGLLGQPNGYRLLRDSAGTFSLVRLDANGNPVRAQRAAQQGGQQGQLNQGNPPTAPQPAIPTRSSRR